MEKIIKHINDTNASYRSINAGDAKNTDLFLDRSCFELFKDAGEKVKIRLHKDNLTQSILFIASILPRKYDNSSIHKHISFSRRFVYNQLAILDKFFTVDGNPVDTKIQEWNLRINVPMKNGEIDERFYFNGLIENIEYIDADSNAQIERFTIRNYLAGGYSDIEICRGDGDYFDLKIRNTNSPYDDGKDKGIEQLENPKLCVPHQVIYYGAPGTGKSYVVKQLTKGKNVIRTTFHPDSDYSTFVGTYKPTVVDTIIYDGSGHRIKEDKEDVKEKRIVYEFVGQAFFQAYIDAWKQYAENMLNPEPQFLVIEEINRGNCAQIFGDLFQLLDRNEYGFSDYPISADIDLKKQLSKSLAGLDLSNLPEEGVYNAEETAKKIVSGETLILPPNLYILATMNTSDQSLFPIDSAFKRRWDWKYIPISEGKENTMPLGWVIEINGKKYDWWKFLQTINNEVGELTKSEDKKLGYFFCKAKDKKIDAETFTSKVIFYLWNDVFKDNGFDQDYLQDQNNETLTFQRFYTTDKYGNTIVNVNTLEIFMQNLGIDPIEEDTNRIKEETVNV